MRAFGAEGRGASALKRAASTLRRALQHLFFSKVEWRVQPEGDDQVRAQLARLGSKISGGRQ